MTTLRVHSTPLIYSPGIFAWIENMMKFDPEQAGVLLLALGIPIDFVNNIIDGKYEKSIDGEALILEVESDSVNT